MTEPILDLRQLAVHFPITKGFLNRTVGRIRAVDGVDLSIRPGETLGLVGESGCGKTTLGRAVAGIHRPTAGQIHYRAASGGTTDLATLGYRQVRGLRSRPAVRSGPGQGARALKPFQREIRVVFQDPFSSLNPRMTLLRIVGEPLQVNRIASGSELEDRAADMLTRVGLSPKYLRRYPHALSGGERQRVNIARALILRPRVVIADEPVSALDVSVRAQILNLLRELQTELDLTLLFISHDLSVVESICDRVAVMYLGRIVELSGTTELYTGPRHPYTEALLSAVPRPDPDLRDTGRRVRLADDLPDPANPPAGCRFHTRCPYAVADTCDVPAREPELAPAGPAHQVACVRTGELTLAGIAPDPVPQHHT